jgi:predicted Zn-dependent protease
MQARRWNDGEVALRKAIRLDPNNTQAVDYLATLLAQKGRPEESVALMREIAIANPVAVDLQRNYATMLFRARRNDDSIAQCERVIHLNPDHLAIYPTYAHALVEKGRYQEADAAFRKGNLMNPGILAWLYVREGNREGALKLLKDNSSLVGIHTAVARYLLGEQERGLAELDVLANERWNLKTYNLRNDPTFDPMRNDPRFTAIVQRTGLYNN